jgi:streptogramin lyase
VGKRVVYEWTQAKEKGGIMKRAMTVVFSTLGLLFLFCNAALAWYLWPTRMEEWDTGGRVPYEIRTLTDGSVWATHDDGATGGHGIVLTIDPETGTVTEYPAPGSARFQFMDRAPDDTLWLSDPIEDRILNFNPAADFDEPDEDGFTSHDLPVYVFGADPNPKGVSVDPTGRVWFTCVDDNSIGMYDPAVPGTGDPLWLRYPVPADDGYGNALGQLACIAFDDVNAGTVWFTINETGGQAGLGKLTTDAAGAGVFDIFVDPRFFDYPGTYTSPRRGHGIRVVDGTVWFMDVKTTPFGTLVKFQDDATSPLGTGYSLSDQLHDCHFLAVDPDGVVWLTAWGTSAIGAFHYYGYGGLQYFKTASESQPMGITIHPITREVWYTTTHSPGQTLGRIIPVRAAKWLPHITVGGEYGVYARWRAAPENATEAQYWIMAGDEHGEDVHSIPVNQQLDGTDWFLLAMTRFYTGTGAFNIVELWDSSDGRVVADAIGLDSDLDGTPDMIIDDGDSNFSLDSGGTCFSGISGVYGDDFCYFGDRQDFDDDGLYDAVDTDPFVTSNAFEYETDTGHFSGTIVDPGDQDITIAPAPFADGVRISADCTGGAEPARLDFGFACSTEGAAAVRFPLSPCQDVVMECGSAVLGVLVGPVRFEIGEGVFVTVPTRAKASVTEIAQGIFEVVNAGKLGTITIESRGEVIEATPGQMLVVEAGVTKVCSFLGDDPKPSLLDQDIFTFNGTQGEGVTVRLEADPSGSHTGERATLVLKDRMRRVWLVRIDRSALPNEIAVTLPASGTYDIIVGEQPKFALGRRFRGNYCLTLESSQDAWQTLATTRWVE